MKRILFLFACACLMISCAKAADVHLMWDASPSPEATGYKVYLGNDSRQYEQFFDVGDVTEYIVQGLGAGTWYFSVTAYDDQENESGFSNEVWQKIDLEAPVGLKIITVIVRDGKAVIEQ